MAINIRLTPRAAKSVAKIKKSDRIAAKALNRRFDELGENPLPRGAKHVEGAAAEVYTIPFHGDYGRIIYRIAAEKQINIILVGTREEIYQKWRHFIG